MVFLILSPLEVLPNDSEASIIGETVKFKKSQYISMETEKLIIRPKHIEVIYQFKNNSKKDIETQVAFPIRQDILDPSDWLKKREGTTWEPLKSESYLSKKINFSATVDNKKIETSGKVRKFANRLELIYFWKQKFPAGKIIEITHSYFPGGGFPLPPIEKEYRSEISALEKNYCIKPILKRWMKKNAEHIYTNQIYYILKTGANWKGPIKKFQLFIEKESSDQEVSCCIENLKKIDSKTFFIEKTNLIPTQDIKILYLELHK